MERQRALKQKLDGLDCGVRSGAGNTLRLRAPRITSAGFTLVELVVVLILVGLVTALTLPNLSRSLDRMRLRRVVQEMTATARHARGQAILKQAPQWIGLDLEQDLYWLGEGFAEDGVGDDGAVRKESSSLPSEVDLQDFQWLDGREASEIAWIQFYPNGSSSGGSFALIDKEGKGIARINLESFTGIATAEVGRLQ